MSLLALALLLGLPAHAGGLAWCDALPTPEAPAASADPSCVREEGDATFAPELAWRWTRADGLEDWNEIMMAPVVGRLLDLDGDGDRDEDDAPTVAFVAFADDGEGEGVLFLLDGSSGEVELALESVADGDREWRFSALSGLALGDLDGDGTPEIVGVSEGGEALLCVGPDGSLRWAVEGSFPSYDLPAIADLDGDGRAEVLADGGVWSAEGAPLWSTADAVFPFAVDLDGDEGLEVVAGAAVWDEDGAALWSEGAGYAATADLDLDGDPEIVVVNAPSVRAFDADGALRWESTVPSPGGFANPGGAPLIADLDGDGGPEIGVAGSDVFVAFDADGSELWTATTSDASARTWGSAADLDGDGAAEIIYADSQALYVLDGASGAVLYEEPEHASPTWLEGAVVADATGDGVADLVVGNSNLGGPGWSGLAVLTDPSWQPARPVWNQASFDGSGVLDDLSIPAAPEPAWASTNVFRANTPGWGLAHWAVDLALVEVTPCAASCADRTVSLWLGVTNDGRVEAEEATLTLSREDGAVAASLELSPLAAGEGVVLGPITLDREDWGEGTLVATLEPVLPDGDCEPEDQSLDLGRWPFPYAEDDLDCDGLADAPGETGETGERGETGVTRDTGPGKSTPIAGPDCGCSAAPAPSAPLALAMLLLSRARRRAGPADRRV